MYVYVICIFFSVKTYLEQPSPLLFASQWSPSHWKNNSFCVRGRMCWRHRWLVCVPAKDVLLCVRSLCSASPHFSPLFSRGKRFERHHFKAHTATYAFPCQQSELTLSHISLRISIPTFFFFSITWSSWFCYCNTRLVFALPTVDVYTS